MSEEEKNAIEKLKNGKTINIYTLLRTLKKEGIENFVITRKQYIQTVLNLIQSQQKEIESLKQAGEATETVYKMQLEKKDKIIDLMATDIYGMQIECNRYFGNIEEVKEKFEKKVEGK